MATIVTLGELLLRLSPPGFERLLQSGRFDTHFGGAEANVAVALAQWGHRPRFVSCLPPGPLGDAGERALGAEGVDTRHVMRCGHRLGLYFAEAGVGARAPQVIYDRTSSAMAEIEGDTLTDALTGALGNANWFHTTGITPALGVGPLAAVRQGLVAARRLGVTSSLDLNYRAALWSPTDAQTVLRPLLRNVDWLLAGAGDLPVALGVEVPDAATLVTPDGRAALDEALSRLAAELGPRQVGVTFRDGRSASENGYRAVLWQADADGDDAARLTVGPRHVVPMIDRIGAGDAFAAGLIHAQQARMPPMEAVAFATAAGVLKHTIPGDWSRGTVDEVARLAAGHDARVRR